MKYADDTSRYTVTSGSEGEFARLVLDTTFDYDALGRLTATTLPSSERIEHCYSDGQRTRTTTPEGTLCLLCFLRLW